MLVSGVGVAIAFIAAGLLSSLLVSPVRNFMIRRNAVDSPDGVRKIQAASVPLSGGPTIFLAVMAIGTAGSFLTENSNVGPRLWLTLALPAAFIFVVGVYDDLFAVTANTKLFFQIFGATIASLLLLSSETRISLFEDPRINLLVGTVWIVLITNAFNLIDNTDGHSSTISIVSATAFAIIAALNGQWLISSLSAALAGAILGFLPTNWFPAKAYLGDSGALFIGFLLATISLRIELESKSELISALVICFAFAVPLIDTSVAVLGRISRRISPFTPGRDHLAHRLSKTDASPTPTVLRLGGMAVFFATISILLYFSKETVARLGAVFAVLILVTIVFGVLARTSPK